MIPLPPSMPIEIKDIPKIKDLLKIKSKENHEKMVAINGISPNIICKYEKKDMIKYLGNNIFVRKTVAKKLLKISDKLIKKYPEYKLKIVYGYRHPDIQLNYFKNKKRELAQKYPNLSDNELNEKTHLFVGDSRVAGHPTGGAIDITIVSLRDNIDMGTIIADYTDENKIQTFSKFINKEQRKNRDILLKLMLSEKFAPFYGEWWHFSYGDKEWAWFYKKKEAIYEQIKINKKDHNYVL